MEAEARSQSATEWSNDADGPQELVVASGISLRLWRLYAQAWLVCLLFPILTLIDLHLPLLPLLLICTGLAIFVACYSYTMWSHPLRRTSHDRWVARRSAPLLIGLVVFVLMLSLAYGSTFLWLLVGVSAMAGVLLPPRQAFLAVMALTLLTLGCSVALAGTLGAIDWLHVIPLILLVRGLGLDMVGLVRLASALREVHHARGELARMAVMEERMRMARDLHDLLGHRLTMITLKSELAARLVDQEPARAAREMREVEQTARQTLREVRVTVAGYRQPTLHSELDGARQLLDAAGIATTIEQTAPALPPAIDTALAWVVREGVTNVIRHSRADHCTIRVAWTEGRVYAEVINDGDQRQSQRTPDRVSSGLAGLTERIGAAGGHLEAGPFPAAGPTGFRLWVELPVPNPIATRKEPCA